MTHRPDIFPSRLPSRLPIALLILFLVAAGAAGEDGWRQWGGGPRRTFKSDARGLATAWPEGGPKVLWQRPLGDGFSGIVAADGRLYTMVHRGDEEAAIALDAATGETLWESAYPAPAKPGMNLEFGPGPHATPALAGGRLFTVGATVKVHAFDAQSGRVLWSHDLMEELGTPLMERGFAASPLAYGDLVVVAPGGEGTAVVAFRQGDGTIAWKAQSFRPSYSSPILARVGDEDQIVVAMGAERAGLDPQTGELEWQLTLRPEAAAIMSTQLWGDDGILFGSTAYADGSRAIRVTKEDGHFVAKELWYNSRMRVQHGSVVRLGDKVYGSSGDFGPTFLTAVDIATGELLFRQRGFTKANLLWADGKLLILDEEGELAIGTPNAEGIGIHSRATVLEPHAWTPPTLVGTRLYLRDRKRIKALELGS